MLSYDLSPFDGFEEIPYSTHGDGDWTYEDTKQSPLLENSGWGQYQGGIDGIMIDGMGINGNATSRNSLSSKFLTLAKQRNSSKPFKSSKRDLKHRLGPVQSVKQRLGPALNVGKSLGVAPIVKKKLPWFKLPKRKILDDCEQNINAKGVISSEVKKKRYAKTEPPEDTEEFMQLVQNAFLKFVKLLNENSFNRRKYLEKGGAGTLKCSICCSGSKEFVDTLSLAQHAFMSCKIGSRSEHLGLHKALCVLMGWKNTKVLNGQWVRQILPESEASSLKEDLIIWPPVVIIHNSSITNHNLNERMIVSIEGLKDILRGMGCEQRMTNLCRGKAANQSTMVVSFSGTFSGLQAAERLHGHFGEKKRGRAEFEQTISKGCKNNGEDTRRTLADKVESVIYGYLGIASDLDKLDFEIKKRCVVKSKKEIEAIANATFNTK
ncbi:hypothetical protein JCGZ_10907 [Jatropha curcas]|uniref:XS domain-containing protein n=2 Tax=Jatropha curcas TaxID=180498 RepID=A0A067KF33_JATCU|nr:hypothetical protein JCGZ_10907 [Jatropha curcas]